MSDGNEGDKVISSLQLFVAPYHLHGFLREVFNKFNLLTSSSTIFFFFFKFLEGWG